LILKVVFSQALSGFDYINDDTFQLGSLVLVPLPSEGSTPLLVLEPLGSPVGGLLSP